MEHSEDFARAYAALVARAPENEIEPGLERIRRVMELMGDPQNSYRSIHIAGTNGKTTTARVAEAILMGAGLRVGRITSPHLHSPTERIAIDGDPISEADFVQAFEDVMPFVERVDEESLAAGGPRMTMFEVLTAMQFQAFATAPVDAAVIETGLGGTWDATNIIDSDVTVITSISLDHQEYLGDTIEEIAGEKAGILKPGAIAVLGAQKHPSAMDVLQEVAEERGITAAVEGEQIAVLDRVPGVGGQMLSVQGIAGRYDDVFLPLLGEHMASNALLAIAAAEAFLGGGDEPLNLELLREAAGSVTSPGRAEVVRQSPTIVVDAAHNPAGAEALVETVRENFRFTSVTGIVAVLQEKDVQEILSIFEPLMDTVVITQTSSPRAIPADRLSMIAEDVFGDEDRVIEAAHLPDAIQRAVDIAEAGGDSFGGIVAAGSVTLSAEVRQLLGRDGEV
ncbi:bifunctional folylpolyglutamate synthase/dihydrofolate synthase [Helcobacillus massiliensis]|uniref:bifunctional folylpolyglutamate synthase/dihydrofolate synthase n=1 Tax=Helcobacillus massiliensis TaxID=521392 RepID=UPI0021A72EAA|nr:folylpolyglutamate synthase/dihydrofolate synthase family protein [Helcobacillus massiliensis]MCT1557923.1 bifunctional folylpolyglutamate synthase/dihydrofolate synthase [Helcobacillus massiliensis]MCT2036547.1 bifunctional folylpolyglutamate synthase/dihydrofolate synthase [Helcobacillus massiliensis]MCT2332552.1 bifunctional folylpolyglutamate synthase/dihydrofolate synthase [Helcobacillus massiliensis]